MRPIATRAAWVAGVLLALLASATAGADGNALSRSTSTRARLFPSLTRLSHGLVEFIFGPSPPKVDVAGAEFRKSLVAKYSDDVVLRFNLTTVDDERALSAATSRLFLDVWAFTKDFVDVRIHREDVASLLSLLPLSLQNSYSSLISDVAEAVYATYPTSHLSAGHLDQPVRNPMDLAASMADGDNAFFRDYQPLPVIYQWMRLLEAMFPSIVRLISVGTSYEGRDIPALRVAARNRGQLGQSRKTILITGGLHAREWISTTTVNYVAWSFITSYGHVPMITKLLERFDIIFMPVVNPDGVEYTWQVDRLWRKSRQHTNLRFCRGLDLDHAFGFEWDGMGPRNDPCSESYGGDEPFQATEALTLAQWARNESANGVQFVGFLDLHSYSQQILYPFSYSCNVDPPNLENLEELGAGLAKAMRLSNGEFYSVASACEGAVLSRSAGTEPIQRIESGGGSAIDWFYHELRARFSYQIKLRDTGSYGFLLPSESIVPTGEEMFSAMKYFGDFLLGNNGIEVESELQDNSPRAPSEPLEEDHAEAELRRRRRKR